MEQHTDPVTDQDKKLWSIAEKRAEFRRNLAYYFVIMAFLWLIWLLRGAKIGSHGIPWPVWPTAGWGVGMIFYYLSAYRFPEENATEKEYQKLKRRQKQ